MRYSIPTNNFCSKEPALAWVILFGVAAGCFCLPLLKLVSHYFLCSFLLKLVFSLNAARHITCGGDTPGEQLTGH